MSTSVKLNMSLLVSNGILPSEIARKIFEECVEEQDLKIEENKLMKNSSPIGILKFSNRIVLTGINHTLNRHMDSIEKIRKLFAEKAEVAQKNYLYNRKKEAERQRVDSEAYVALVAEIDKEEKQMKKALIRQKEEACLALKEELIETAQNNGYEIEESVNSDNHIQLQLVRQSY